MERRFLPFFLCLALTTGGCARSDDGTVIIPRPLDLRRVWERGPSRTETPRLARPAEVFPVAPTGSRPAYRVIRQKGVKPVRRGKPARPAEASAVPSPAPVKPLACRDVTEPGKRIHVVCD